MAREWFATFDSRHVTFKLIGFAAKIDPTHELLASFIDLNNLALARFTPAERSRLGVHTCPGGDRDSTHSAQVDYAELLPSLFQLHVPNFYIALAGETDRPRVLRIIREHLRPEHRVFVGVVAPIDPRIETAQEVRERVLEAAYATTPERSVRRAPTPPELPTAAWINKPAEEPTH